MKTYRDLIEYAQSIEPESDWFDMEKLGAILEDYELWTELNRENIPNITYKVIVSKEIDSRAYHVSLWYYCGLPFAYYAYGGRSSGDHENIKMLDSRLYMAAKTYVATAMGSLEITDIEEYLEPEYGDYYVWQFLDDVEKPQIYKAISICIINGEASHKTYEIGYTPKQALAKLGEHQEWYRDEILRVSQGEAIVEYTEASIEPC